jgi:hypothetical protein
MSSGDCIDVSGAGTAVDPFVADLVLDPDLSNLLSCGPDGLYAATASVEGVDCIGVTGVGSAADPYVVALTVDPATNNEVVCAATGILVESPFVVRESLVGSAVPDAGAKEWRASYAGTTDADGEMSLDITTAGFAGYGAPMVCMGDLITIGGGAQACAIVGVDLASCTLALIRVRVQDNAGAAVVGTVRVNLSLIGWT